MKKLMTLCFLLLLSLPAWAGGPWFINSSTGNDANDCLSSGSACLTLAHAEALSSAGDTFNFAAGTYRLSTANNSTSGLITPKENQTFIGPACTPKIGPTPCTAIISGGKSIGNVAVFDGFDWKVTGQTQAGTVTSYSCDPAPYDGCNQPEDLFYDGVPLIHILSATRPNLATGQWWFDYTNHIIYFHDTPSGHIVETSILKAVFAINGVNGITLDSLTVKEFAAPLGSGAIMAQNAPASSSAGLNWTVKNCYITLNHGGGVETSFGLNILNSVLTVNGQQGAGGGSPAGVAVTPSGIIIQGNIVTFNNFSRVDPGFGAGGIKMGNVVGAVVRGNTVSNNLGNAIHLDTNSVGGLIDGNDIEGNFDPTAISGGSSSGWGIVDEISQGGLVARNNYVKFNGAGGAFGIVSSTSVGMQAYCNVVEQPGTGNTIMAVVASNRGNRLNQPGLGTPNVSTGNYFHHNTLIWDIGATGHTGYVLIDTVNQPNFFTSNTPPDFNTYHMSNVASAFFEYDNNSTGANILKSFPNYRASGADINGTIDTIYTRGFPSVVITSPVDQAQISNPVTISALASDGSGINKVEFYVDWVLQSTVNGAGPYNFTWASSTLGLHTITAMAYSTAGVRNCNAITTNTLHSISPPTSLQVVIH